MSVQARIVSAMNARPRSMPSIRASQSKMRGAGFLPTQHATGGVDAGKALPAPYCDRMPANRKEVTSGSDYESVVGYSRAVRVGPHVAVAGTTGTGPAGDITAQTRDALRRIEIALQQAGAALADVVRTRVYVTDISRWREVAAVHREVFGDIRPAATMVEVSALIAPELLVEIEADAYLDR
jgi:enamine deaminase RidA (YjgF/YER057c/UK114 family)